MVSCRWGGVGIRDGWESPCGLIRGALVWFRKGRKLGPRVVCTERRRGRSLVGLRRTCRSLQPVEGGLGGIASRSERWWLGGEAEVGEEVSLDPARRGRRWTRSLLRRLRERGKPRSAACPRRGSKAAGGSLGRGPPRERLGATAAEPHDQPVGQQCDELARPAASGTGERVDGEDSLEQLGPGKALDGGMRRGARSGCSAPGHDEVAPLRGWS